VGGAKGTLNKATNIIDDRATNTRIPETIIDGFRGDMHTLTNLLRNAPGPPWVQCGLRWPIQETYWFGRAGVGTIDRDCHCRGPVRSRMPGACRAEFRARSSAYSRIFRIL
jgi:hypothetical protein